MREGGDKELWKVGEKREGRRGEEREKSAKDFPASYMYKVQKNIFQKCRM